MSTHPWDPMPGEPADSHARFLLYRNLGPGRTLKAAYRAFRATFRNAAADATTRLRTLPVPGHWCEDSARWRWGDRAVAWDIHHLSTGGQELAVRFVGALAVLARKAAEALSRPGCRPRSWKEAVAVMDVLARYVTPPVVDRARQTAGGLTAPPADGGAGPPRSAVK